MKASKFKTLRIIIASILYTAYTCGASIVMRVTRATTRKWVDKELNAWVNRILNAVGVKVKVVNPHNTHPTPGTATIIMSNHSSLYDIPISIKAFPKASIRMLAKKELSKIPIMSGGMTAAEFPFVDRKDRRQAIKDLKAAEKLMKSGIVLWIAPEGTRSKDGKLAAFKKGGFITAINAKATIIPIGIRGAYDILPARTKRFNINSTAEVHIGEAIDASQFTQANKQALIDKTHDVMKKLVGEG